MFPTLDNDRIAFVVGRMKVAAPSYSKPDAKSDKSNKGKDKNLDTFFAVFVAFFAVST